MRLLLIPGALLGCAMVGWGADLPLAPAPRKIPALKCELRWIGGELEVIDGGKRRALDTPDRAEVKITNISKRDVDIGSMWGPRVHLDLKVKDPAGKDMTTEPYGSRFSLQWVEHKPHILKPGKSFQWEVCLLSIVPEKKLVAGTYKVKAIYTVGNKDYESDWVEVKWAGNKK